MHRLDRLRRGLDVASFVAVTYMLIGGTNAICTLRLDLDSQASRFTLTVNNQLLLPGATRGLNSASVFNNSVARGFSGTLYATSASLASCPPDTDAAAWEAALPSFSISTSPPSSPNPQPLAVYPRLHMGKTALAAAQGSDVWDYNVTDLQISANVSDIAPLPGGGGGGGGGRYSSAFSTQLASGMLVSDNSVTGRRNDDLRNLTSNPTGVELGLELRPASGGSRPQLVLSVPSVVLVYQAIGEVQVGSTTYRSLANYTLTSSVTASTTLGCSQYCGDFGRCTNAGCVCECDWQDAASGPCTVPSSRCEADRPPSAPPLPPQASSPPSAPASPPSPPSNPISSPSPPTPSPPSPAPDNSNTPLCNATLAGGLVSPVNGSCPAGYDWDKYFVACEPCALGFSGKDCGFCSTDTACQASLGSSTATCALTPLYRARSHEKHYACALEDPAIVGILGPTLDFTCSTTPPQRNSSVAAGDLAVGSGLVGTNTPVGTTPYCTMSFRLRGMARDAPVICTGWQCAFSVDRSTVNCPYIKCECPKGCRSDDGTLTEATFTNLESSVTISCGQEAGRSAQVGADGSAQCSIELTGLPITAIPATCRTAECLDPVNGTLAVTGEAVVKNEALAVAPIVAWVPSMVLVLLLAAAGASVASFFAPGPGTPRPSRAAGPVAEGAEPEAGAASSSGGDGCTSGLVLATGSGSGTPSGSAMPAVGPDAVQLQQAQQAGDAGQQRPQEGSVSEPWSPAGGGGTTLWSTESSGGGARGGGAGGGGGGGGAAGDSVVGLAGDGLEAEEGQVWVRELSWQDVSVSTWPRRRLLRLGTPQSPPATLLRGVSGRAVAGELLGILGPSGSGKTSLLNVLAGLVTRGSHWDVRGALAVDGHPVGTSLGAARALGAVVGHVPQRDLLCRSLTVRECVVASAALRCGWREARRGRRHLEARADATLSELGIAHLAHRFAHAGAGGGGDEGGAYGASAAAGALSGGERLRVSAAMELAAAPRLLLLDEPLSGLDSANARSILALLRNIAVGAPNGNGGGGGGTSTRGRIVATSMHQPSPQLFAMLDTVLLMAGGRVAYFGPPAGVAAALAAAGAPPPLLYDNGHANGNALHVLTDGDKPAVHDNDSVKPVNHQPEVVAVAVAEHMLDAVSDPRVAARMCDLHAAAVAAAAAHGLPPTAPPPTYRLSAHPLPPSNPNATSHPHPYPTYATIYVTDNNAGEPSDPYVRRLVRARQEPGVVGWLRRLRLELGVLLWRCGLDLLRHPSNLALHLTVTAAVGLLVGGVFANVQNDISGAQNRVGAIFFSVMLLACLGTSAVDAVHAERPLTDRDLLRSTHGLLPHLAAKLLLDAALLRALPAVAYALPFYWIMGLRPTAAAFFTFLGAFVTMACLAGAACIALGHVFGSPGRTVLIMNLLLLTCALFSGFLANKASIVWPLRWIVYISPIRYCWEAVVINELRDLTLNFSSPDLPQGLPAVRGSLFLSLLGVDSGLLVQDLVILGCIYAAVVLLALGAAWCRLAWLRGRLW